MSWKVFTGLKFRNRMEGRGEKYCQNSTLNNPATKPDQREDFYALQLMINQEAAVVIKT